MRFSESWMAIPSILNKVGRVWLDSASTRPKQRIRAKPVQYYGIEGLGFLQVDAVRQSVLRVESRP